MSIEEPAEIVAHALASFVPRLARNIAVALEEEPSLSLSLRQLRILERLVQRPHRTNELAVQSMVSQPTATAAIAPLEARGLVLRRPDPDDGRAHLIEMTSQGHELLKSAHARIERRLLDVIGDVRPEQAAEVERLQLLLLERMDVARADRVARKIEDADH